MKRCSYCGQENPDAAQACSGCGKSLLEATEPAIDSKLLDPALSPVVVATFNNVAEASVLKGRLVAAGNYCVRLHSARRGVPMARYFRPLRCDRHRISTPRTASRRYPSSVSSRTPTSTCDEWRNLGGVK